MYFNRYNICAMQGQTSYKGKVRNLERNFHVYPCFAAAFRFVNCYYQCNSNINYKLVVYKNFDVYTRYNNFALVPKKQMCLFLNSLKILIPFTYKFIEDSEEKYVVELSLNGKILQHKALLMFSRALFEYPHNIALHDAFILRDFIRNHKLKFKDYSLVNLYIACLSSFCFERDESIIVYSYPKLIDTYEFKKFLTKRNLKPISDQMPYKQKNFSYSISGPDCYDDFFDPDYEDKRIKTHIKKLKFIIND